MKIIFNSSMPRSGSTLLQNILAQNPNVYASPTSGVLELLYGARLNYAECEEFKSQDKNLMAKGFSAFCKNGLEGWYGSITDRPVCIDKSRGWIGYSLWVEKFLDNPKYLVCIRDLRHVLASMEQLYRKNADKGDKMESPSNMQFMTIHQRVDSWLAGQPVGLSLLRLYDAIQKGEMDKMCIVRYEDIVLHPNEVLKRVYSYIEEPFYQHDFEKIPQLTHEQDNTIYGEHTIRNTLSVAATDPYKLLGADCCDRVVEANKWFFDYFYSPKSRFY